MGFRPENDSDLPMATRISNEYNNELVLENANDNPSVKSEKQDTRKERTKEVAANAHYKQSEKIEKQKETGAKGNNQFEKEKKIQEFKEKEKSLASEVTLWLLLNTFFSFFFFFFLFFT